MTSPHICLSLVILILPFFRHGNQNKERLHFPRMLQSPEPGSGFIPENQVWVMKLPWAEDAVLGAHHTHPRVQNTPSTSSAPERVCSDCHPGATHSHLTLHLGSPSQPSLKTTGRRNAQVWLAKRKSSLPQPEVSSRGGQNYSFVHRNYWFCANHRKTPTFF